MNIIKLLEYLQEIIETSPKIPLSGKIAVSKKEAVDTIEQIIDYLPDEFKKAQWVLEEKERILKEAHEEAETIKKNNLDVIKKQIENHDITKEAEAKSDEIISTAKQYAKTMRLNSRDYADDLLSQFEKELDAKGTEMIESIKKDVDSFVSSLQSDVSEKTNTLRSNIKELRNMK